MHFEGIEEDYIGYYTFGLYIGAKFNKTVSEKNYCERISRQEWFPYIYWLSVKWPIKTNIEWGIFSFKDQPYKHDFSV